MNINKKYIFTRKELAILLMLKGVSKLPSLRLICDDDTEFEKELSYFIAKLYKDKIIDYDKEKIVIMSEVDDILEIIKKSEYVFCLTPNNKDMPQYFMYKSGKKIAFIENTINSEDMINLFFIKYCDIDEFLADEYRLGDIAMLEKDKSSSYVKLFDEGKRELEYLKRNADETKLSEADFELIFEIDYITCDDEMIFLKKKLYRKSMYYFVIEYDKRKEAEVMPLYRHIWDVKK